MTGADSSRFGFRFHLALGKIYRDQAGVIAIVTALVSVVIMGFAGLAIDVGYWLLTQRSMQGAADQAAFAAAVAASAGGTSPTIQAKAITASMGFPDGSNGISVTVNNPPSQGSYQSNNAAWEVVVQQPQPMWFANFYRSSSPIVNVRAVALQGGTVMPICVLGLNPTAANTVSISGSATVNLSCALGSNSTNSSGFSLAGSASLTASDVTLTASTYSKSHNAVLSTNDLKVSQSAAVDPYASRNVPPFGGCDYTSYAPTGTVTLNPGVYCNGINIQSGANVTFNPGVYTIVGGVFNVVSNATVTGTGVTIVLTGNANGQTSYATVNIAGGASVNLTAPTSGATSGLVFFQDRNAPQYVSGVNANYDVIAGGSTQKITGAIYFPNQLVDYQGTSASGGVGQCTQVIANYVYFTGNTDVAIQCTGTGVVGTGGFSKLVE